MSERSTQGVTASLRLQADRAPPSTSEEWDIGVSFANAEIQTQVSHVLDTLLGKASFVATETVLTNVCQPKLCADVDIKIMFVHDPQATASSVVIRQLVLGTLRHWLDQNVDAYSRFFDAKITWLAPDALATPLGLSFEGISSEMTFAAGNVFQIETRGVLNQKLFNENNRCQKIVVLNQFVNENNMLEVHTSLLGSISINNTFISEGALLRFFYEEYPSYLDQLISRNPFFGSAHGVIAFALDDTQVSFRNVGVSSPTTGSDVPYRKLNFLNTKNVAIGLACLAMVIIVLGASAALIRKQYQKSKNKEESKDELQSNTVGNEDGSVHDKSGSCGEREANSI